MPVKVTYASTNPDAAEHGRRCRYFTTCNVAAFGETEQFNETMDQMLRMLQDTPPAPGEERVIYPGIPEYEAELERREDGIPTTAKSSPSSAARRTSWAWRGCGQNHANRSYWTAGSLTAWQRRAYTGAYRNGPNGRGAREESRGQRGNWVRLPGLACSMRIGSSTNPAFRPAVRRMPTTDDG
jgi:hypothetical protein